MDPLLSKLNDAQREAVTHLDGPLVVFAGAGSGKTRVITHRIAHLILQGVKPWEIIAVTFTNKAAGEMRERLSKLCMEAHRINLGTFHSLAARWLREFGPLLGFKSDYTIYDESDATAALKVTVKENFKNIDIAPFVSEMKNFIHTAKTFALFPSEVESSKVFDMKKVPTGAVEIYRKYQEYLAQCQAMDFDDLILNFLLLLRREDTVKRILSQRYRYILVDEFQDTNLGQLEMIERLSEKHKNLCVVGDDDQAIYSWRGASPKHLLNFHRKYPEAKRVILAENYRSASNIVAAANAVIACNQTRVKKELFSNVAQSDEIIYRLESDGEMEAWYVVDRIKAELIRFHYSDFAIFYRTNSQSRMIEEALRRENVPYRIFGAMKFYERAEIKDVLSYLRLLVNEDDDVSLRRVINTPTRGIGDRAIEHLQNYARSNSMPLLKALEQGLKQGDFEGKLAAKFSKFYELLQKLKDTLQASEDYSELIPCICEFTSYQEYLRKKFAEAYEDKTENVHELSGALTEFRRRNPDLKLSDWLQNITMYRDEENSDEGEEGVALMTLHSAKGLEFERVFIVGVEDGLLPHRSNMEKGDLLEEERRLFYVGMTRARKKLTLLSARQRSIYSQFMMNEPSVFLREIPKKHLLLEGVEVGVPSYEKSSIEMNSAWDDGDSRLSYDYEDDHSIEGSVVRHPTYGKGVLEGVDSSFGVAKATVRFFEFGRRKVSLSQLERIHT